MVHACAIWTVDQFSIQQLPTCPSLRSAYDQWPSKLLPGMSSSVAQRVLGNGNLQRCLASICYDMPALLASSTTCSSGIRCSHYSTDASEAAQKKLHVLKCTKAVPTPVSQAVAFMISKDQMPKEQLLSNMDTISEQLSRDVDNYSSTELSAFTEACRYGRSTVAFPGGVGFLTWVLHARLLCADARSGKLPML